MKSNLALVVLLAAALTACGERGVASTDLSDTPHSVETYYADAALAAATVESCRARNPEEGRLMAGKEACRNVRLATSRKTAETTATTERDFNEELRAAKKRYREAKNS